MHALLRDVLARVGCADRVVSNVCSSVSMQSFGSRTSYRTSVARKPFPLGDPTLVVSGDPLHGRARSWKRTERLFRCI